MDAVLTSPNKYPVINWPSISGSGEYLILGVPSQLEDIQKKGFDALFRMSEVFASNIYVFSGKYDSYKWVDLLNFSNAYFDVLYKTILTQQSKKSDKLLNRRAFNNLFAKYSETLNKSGYQPSLYQRKTFVEVLKKVASFSCSTMSLQTTLSEDNELLLLRETTLGTHYISVGSDEGDVSYIWVSFEPGKYDSLHYENGISIDKIVEAFVIK